jgi:hypothetical protein
MTGTDDASGSRRTADLTDKARELWRDRVSPIKPDLLGIDLLDSVRDFLVSTGLPTGVPDFEFFHDDRLRPAARLGRGYLVIGDSGLALAVDRARGDVRELYRSESHPPRFVNSSLPAFLICLARFLARRDEIYAAPAEAARVAGELKQEFRDWDPAALADRTTAWSVTLREIGDGLA